MDLARLIARTERRKAAGIDQTHAGKVPRETLPRSSRCAHLGAPTGETVPCVTCSGRVELKLFACAVYGSCVPAANRPGVKSCAGCGEYRAQVAPAPEPM